MPGAEPREQRVRRHGKRIRLYAWAVLFVVLLVALVVLIAENTRSVELDWVFGTSRVSVVWIIVASTVIGWLLGIATSVVFRFRTRRRA